MTAYGIGDVEKWVIINKEKTSSCTLFKYAFKSFRYNELFLTNRLLIRRSQVRILPGAPYNIMGYEIRLIAHFCYVGTRDQTSEGKMR
jgi:hypothetical protein